MDSTSHPSPSSQQPPVVNATVVGPTGPAPAGPLPGSPPAGYAYPLYPPYGPPPPRSLFRRLVGWAGWGLLLVSGLILARGLFTMSMDPSSTIIEKHYSGAKYGRHKIAIIDVSGVIMDGEGFVKKQIDHAREDDSIVAIVLRVDSPGGTVTGSDYLFHHLKKLRVEENLPLVVSMGGTAASGGYYISMAVGHQEKCIFAEPTTTTGSIGVIIPHYDISGLLARFDVKDDSIASHPRKQMLSMTKTMSEDDRKILQEYINESFDRFKSIVKEGRATLAQDDANLTQLATGEIFTAGQAKRHGLVDEIGFLEDAVDRAIELAKVNKNQTRVVRYQRPPSLFEIPGILGQSRASGNELTTLLELAAPRAYYLSTSLPTLLTSRKAQ